MESMGCALQNAWTSHVVECFFRRSEKTVILLTGDAGSGKSKCFLDVCKAFEELGVNVACTATTNTAVSFSPVCKETYFRCFGFTSDTIGVKDRRAFTKAYYDKWGPAIDAIGKLTVNPAVLYAALKRSRHYTCDKFEPRCVRCLRRFSDYVRSLSVHSPTFVQCPVILIDEYGIMNAEDVWNIRYVTNMFFRGQWGPLVILAGSVSQLSTAHGDTSKPLYKDVSFKNSVLHVQPMLINFRQQRDPGFGESLSLMQYNKMSLQAAELFRSRTVVTEAESMDPTYDVSAVRVFNSNERRNNYIDNCVQAQMKKRHVVTYVSPVRVTNGPGKPVSKDVLVSHLKSRFPKLFCNNNKQRKQTVQTCVRSRLFYPGMKVWIVANFGGCHGASDGCIQGKVVSVDPVNDSTTVKLHNGSVTTFKLCSYKYRNWVVETLPLSPCLAFNTYEVQGLTIQGRVIYSPPRWYKRSQLKPSAYVACSRCVDRESLFITKPDDAFGSRYPSFVDTLGDVALYDSELVEYKESFEQGYGVGLDEASPASDS